jgi:hypothetical protein
MDFTPLFDATTFFVYVNRMVFYFAVVLRSIGRHSIVVRGKRKEVTRSEGLTTPHPGETKFHV